MTEPFKILAAAAIANPKKRFVLVLDEINRAEIAKVLGEAFSLMERGYRLTHNGTTWEGRRIRLVYSEDFGLPDNVFIIATMNDVDGTTFELDYALMRRFAQFRLEPSLSELGRMLAGKAPQEVRDAALILLSRLQHIHPIGHVYLKDVTTFEDLRDAYANRIRPALRRSLGRRGADQLVTMDALVVDLIAPSEA